MTNDEKNRFRATYSALYALGKVIPPLGIPTTILFTSLDGKLDRPTFDGLVASLCARKVIEERDGLILRGPEYADGLERIRLTGEDVRFRP